MFVLLKPYSAPSVLLLISNILMILYFSKAVTSKPIFVSCYCNVLPQQFFKNKRFKINLMISYFVHTKLVLPPYFAFQLRITVHVFTQTEIWLSSDTQCTWLWLGPNHFNIINFGVSSLLSTSSLNPSIHPLLHALLQYFPISVSTFSHLTWYS